MIALRLTLCVLIGGCGPSLPPLGDTGTETAVETSSGTGAPSSGTTSTTTSTPSDTTSAPPSTTTGDGTTTGSADDTGVVFLLEPDATHPDGCQCDLFAQDCGEGHKCVPRGLDDTETWDCVRCSPVAEDPRGLGEPCTVEGSGFSGIDDCDAGLMCWDVDPATLQGTCVALCTGNEDLPACEGSTDCYLGNDRQLALCLPTCDPLSAGACPTDESCIPSFAAFVCAPIPDPAGAGQPCLPAQLPLGCEPGLVCMPPELVGPECDQGMPGCCSPLCDVAQGDACSARGQACVPWSDEDPPWPGHEGVGYCGIP